MDLQTSPSQRGSTSMKSPVEKQMNRNSMRISTTESSVEPYYENYGFEQDPQDNASQSLPPASPRSVKEFTVPTDKLKSSVRKILNSQDSPRFNKAGKTSSLPNRSSIRFDSSSLGSAADLETVSSGSIDKQEFTKETVFKMTSIMYAIFIVILSCTFSATDLQDISTGQRQIYNVILAIIGVIWLSVLHYDLQRYKSNLVKKMFPDGNISSIIPVDADGVERLSTATEVIFNNTKFQKRSASVTSINFPVVTNLVPGYRFIRGRESGSFYLKVGMAAFCFGHIIHEGLMLSQQIYYFSSNEKHCLDIARFILYIVRPLYSFYQLFMLFKYSNLVINRHLPLAQFGIMHLIGTSATFWLGAILDDAVEYLENKVNHTTSSAFNSTCDDLSCILPDHLENRVVCSRIALPSNKYDSALPYLYPFAIEFNLILAALWFVVWKNIGKDSHTAHPHHFQHKVCQDLDGNEDVCFESNLVIRADCHASNKGLFGGMFILLLGLITMILFFVSVHTKGYEQIAVYIFTSQEIVISGIIGIVSVIAFKQMQKLNINPYKNSSHTLDILLLMIPLPFYFLNNILSIRSDIAKENWSSLCMHFVITTQILLQTVFISTTMHRCSNDRQLRFKKPGRELITLMILLNISLWIISTFESKAVEKHMTQPAYYGAIMWMVISHTTLPLMLFYRFHATVCLADIWKFAYEKAHL